MNWKRAGTTALLAVVVMLGMVGCPKKPPTTPAAPTGPDTAWTGVSTSFKVATESKSGAVRFVVNWGDAIDTTDEAYASGDTATVSHTWASAGTATVKAMAVLDADPSKASDWSGTKSVTVLPNTVPVLDSLMPPPVAVKNVAAVFNVSAHDPNGDSVKVAMTWGDTKDTTSSYDASPAYFQLTHTYTKIETITVKVKVIDIHGAESPQESARVVVGTAGAVMWYWWNNDQDRGALTTSPVIASDGTSDCIYSACEDDYKFYAIRISTGKDVHNQTTKFPEYAFSGHPAVCTAQNGTQHIIVGSDEGEIYAFKMTLGKDWQWPNKGREDSLTNLEWGAPATNGSKFYVSHADDSIFYFDDFGPNGQRTAAYCVHATVVDAPAIDASGNVYFGTDSGYLYKMPGDLATVTWRIPVQGNGDIHGPVIGGDGTIYCTSDSGRIYAVNSDSTIKWSLQLSGEAPRPVIGATAIYVGAQSGWIYSISPSGTVNWSKQYGTSDFPTAPVLAANGYMYFQNDVDVLYCLDQQTGSLIWYCDCPRFLPRGGGRARQLQITDYEASPSIDADGNIVVIGSDAMYLVAGYTDGTLATSAPWPKWQHDLLNTGK